jgi:hypothetical protein
MQVVPNNQRTATEQKELITRKFTHDLAMDAPKKDAENQHLRMQHRGNKLQNALLSATYLLAGLSISSRCTAHLWSST